MKPCPEVLVLSEVNTTKILLLEDTTTGGSSHAPHRVLSGRPLESKMVSWSAPQWGSADRWTL